MGLSRMVKMVKVRRECPYKDTCENKKKVSFAYLPEPVAVSASAAAAMIASAEIIAKHNYREICIDQDTRVTIDLEEVKKQLERDFYKSIGLVMGFGNNA
ncbi:MAG TPA: hypothetical protein VN441_14730 [Syntrophomonas sp.]|nr:hypothetical protein [Syntrophomonas sp.]